MLKSKIFLSLFFLFFCICACAQDEAGYDPRGGRNPFMPLLTADGRLIKSETDTKADGLSLEGIIYDKGGLSYALVNGAVARIGDRIDDYQVLRIEKDRVIFIKEGQPLEVEIKKEED